METSLGDLLYPAEKKGYQMSIKEILKLTIELSAGLTHIHPIIIHRDLKPANILLDKKKCAKIADFGLSRIKVGSISVVSALCPYEATITVENPHYILCIRHQHTYPQSVLQGELCRIWLQSAFQSMEVGSQKKWTYMPWDASYGSVYQVGGLHLYAYD